MSAVDSALRVLRWALREEPQGPPPRGDFFAPEALLRPSAELTQELSRLTLLSAARLRLDNPPLGDRRAPGADSLVLALAIAAAATPAVALGLLASVPRTDNASEWLLRHALVAPALPHLPHELGQAARAASPLTALWVNPPGQEDARPMAVAERFRVHRQGRIALQLRLAEPADDPTVRAWRTRLLQRYRTDPVGRSLVFDVYETALIHFGEGHRTLLERALAVFSDPLAARDDARLEDAFTIADFWGPLRALERTALDELRDRRYLGYTYREGIRVHQLGRRLRGI
jgi:hypothetical protein